VPGFIQKKTCLIVLHKRVPRLAQLAALVGAQVPGGRKEAGGAAQRQRGAAEQCARRAMRPGGEKHRGRERGIPDRRLRIGSGTFKDQRQTPTWACDSTNTVRASLHAQHRDSQPADTPLLQAMSGEEKYEGAQEAGP
jgi:hypothetical protein